MFIVFSILFAFHISISQDKKVNAIYLDSLLLEGNFSAFIATWKELSNTPEIQDMSQDDAEDYNTIYGRFNLLSIADKDRIRELCLTFEKSNLILNAYQRGDKANLACQKFLTAIKNQQYFEALEYYYILTYFNDKYIQQEKIRLRKNYKMAKELFLNGRYDDALCIIEAFEKEEPSKPAFVVLRDSLTFLYSELQKKSKMKKAEIEFNSEKNVVIKQFTISAEIDYTTYQETDDPRMVFHHRTYSDLDVYVGHFPKETCGIYKLRVEYFISNTVSLGVRAAMGTIYSFRQEHIEEDMNLSEKFYSIGILGKYFPGKLLILSPYVSFETGIINVQRNKVELSPTNFWYPEYGSENGPINKINEIYPQITTEIGSEINFGNNDLFYIGVHLYFSNNFGDTRVIQHLNYGAGIRVGVNIF